MSLSSSFMRLRAARSPQPLDSSAQEFDTLAGMKLVHSSEQDNLMELELNCIRQPEKAARSPRFAQVARRASEEVDYFH